jgi:hypothetical protein
MTLISGNIRNDEVPPKDHDTPDNSCYIYTEYEVPVPNIVSEYELKIH